MAFSIACIILHFSVRKSESRAVSAPDLNANPIPNIISEIANTKKVIFGIISKNIENESKTEPTVRLALLPNLSAIIPVGTCEIAKAIEKKTCNTIISK